MKVTYIFGVFHSFKGINLFDHIVNERQEWDEPTILLFHSGLCV